METKGKNYYILAIILLDILLMISLFHAHNVEKNCQSICDKQIENIKDAYNINDYYITGGINDEENTEINWTDIVGNSVGD